SDGDLILKAMRAGAKEFLSQPVQLDDLVRAVERISERPTNRGDAKSRGCSLIAVAGATGGVGSTSLAVNLGCAIAEMEQQSAVLVDLDMCLGDADVFLDTIPEYTIVDVAQNVARLDITLLKRSLTKHSSGLYLLPRPVQLEDVGTVTPDDLTRVVGLMKATFSHVLLDLSKSYSPLDMIAMQQADHVLLITQLDLPSLRNVVRLMMSFGEIDGLKEKVKVIVNRTGLQDSQISMKKAEETIGTEFYHRLPNDYRVMIEVRNNGVPLVEQAPKAAITHSIRDLAAKLCGTTADEPVTIGEPSSIVSKLGGIFGGRK
ncbi:MAG: AAA family ATPase, partial [Pirellulales bacterium]|nr:AAA family ATPase [Pirellulales bacterium]